MSEYNCRDCTLRTRCIEQSHNASSIKIMLHHAFENRTDTLTTWERLQQDCLLVEKKQAALSETSELKSLSRRLHQARMRKDEPVKTIQPAARTGGVVGVEELEKYHNQRVQVALDNQTAVSEMKRKHVTTMFSLSSLLPETPTSIFWLTIEGSWRHITLPVDGSLILGRFDPNIGVPPDIDLAFEDGDSHLVSRRHAVIAGKNDEFTIEDLGSTSGVFLNGQKLGFRPSRSLKPGDRIKIGDISIIFDQIPVQVFSAFNSNWIEHTLTVTATGHKYFLTAPHPVIIGRSDTQFDFVPEIDLTMYGQISRRVSRRHATITWQGGKPFVEDMGSGFGTKLHGALLPLGEAVPLSPGDHIWLAGCVLAYDIDVKVVQPQTSNNLYQAQTTMPVPVNV